MAAGGAQARYDLQGATTRLAAFAAPPPQVSPVGRRPIA